MSQRTDRSIPRFPASSRYEAVRLLGSGGMGAVWEALDRETGARVAVKVMIERGAWGVVRFKREFRAVADLHHPNLVKLFELHRDADTWFFTMQLLDGQDLRQIFLEADSGLDETLDSDSPLEISASSMLREPLEDLDVLRPIVADIIAGLACLHGHGLVHGDLKPSNVVVGEQQAWLVDFGLLSDGEERSSRTPAGTWQYMAPEIWRGEPSTAQTDLYALGCLLFELICGQKPFDRPVGGDPGPPPRLEQRRALVEPPWADLCAALMDPDPARRPDIEGVRAALGIARVGAAWGAETFVGRAAELATLDAALDDAANGRPRWVVIRGESGIGKSCLASQVRARAGAQGFFTLTGRCHPRERVPFGMFDRAIDELVDLLASGSVDAAPVSEALAVLTHPFPAIEALVERATLAPHRPKVFAALVEVFEHCQRRAPLLLVLDDVHWADPDSLALLDAVLDRAAGRMMVLALHQTDSSLPAGAAALMSGATAIDLGGLPAADAEAMLSAAGHVLSETTAVDNPYLLTLLASLDEITDLQTAIELHFARLTPAAARLLELATCFGGLFSSSLLGDIEAVPPDALGVALGELEARNMLRRAVGDRLDVYHNRLRETIYAGLDAVTRRRLHRAIAVTAQARPDVDAEFLLRHWTGAGDSERRRQLLERAAAEAEARMAWARAGHLLLMRAEETDSSDVAMWERAGELLSRAGVLGEAAAATVRALQSTDEDDRPRRLRILASLAEHLVRDGQVDAGVERFAEGMALLGLPLQRSVPGHALALVGLGLRRAFVRRGRGGLDATEEARLEFFERFARLGLGLWPVPALEASLRSDIIARRAGVTRVVLRGLVLGLLQSIALGPRAIRDEGRVRRRARRRVNKARALVSELDDPESEAFLALGEAILRSTRDPHGAIEALGDLAGSYAVRGLEASVDASFVRGVRMVLVLGTGDPRLGLEVARQELRVPRSEYISKVFAAALSGVYFAMTGRLAEAAAALDDVRARLSGCGSNELKRMEDLVAVHVALARGDVPEVFRVLDEAAKGQPSRWLMQVRLMRAEVYVEAVICLARRGRVGWIEAWRARRAARLLIKRGVYGQVGLGWRALGELDASQGRPRAHRALQSALPASREGGPWTRWRCLESAAHHGVLDDAGALELQRLRAEYGFTGPASQ